MSGPAEMGASITTDVTQLRERFAALAEAFQHIADGYRRAEQALADQPTETVAQLD